VPKKRVTDPPAELLTLPTRLKYARERINMTQAALAKRADMDPGQVSRLEKGERGAGIEVAIVIRLARELGVPVGWLAADEGDLPEAPKGPTVFSEDSDRRRKPRGGKTT